MVTPFFVQNGKSRASENVYCVRGRGEKSIRTRINNNQKELYISEMSYKINHGIVIYDTMMKIIDKYVYCCCCCRIYIRVWYMCVAIWLGISIPFFYSALLEFFLLLLGK